MKNKERRNLFYNGIYIELTRRCNLACAHCLRGPAQNKTMTREVIDKLIQNIDWVTQVYITGGEPLLEIDSLCYLIERLSTKIIHNITFTTNGTVKDRKVVDALEAFCIANKLNGNAMIVVSDDKFHSGEHDGLTKGDSKIYINPHVLYSGSDYKQVAILGSFHKDKA